MRTRATTNLVTTCRRYDSVRSLLGAQGVDVDKVESKVSGEDGVEGVVGGVEVEDEMVGAEAVLGGTG